MVIQADLDNLKQWNTLYGLSGGDEALKSIADSLNESIRGGDYVFRRGDKSDEFVLVLRMEKEMSADDIKKVFEDIQKKVTGTFVKVDGKKMPITAALGYLVLKPGESREVKQILDDIDEAQRYNKNPDIKNKRIEEATQRLNKVKPE